jgi:hypothetical protein
LCDPVEMETEAFLSSLLGNFLVIFGGTKL